MTKIIVPPIVPTPLPKDRFAQNGDIPSQTALRRAAWCYNHVAIAQRKMVFAIAHDTQSTPAPGTTSESPHHFIFRTGENLSHIEFVVGLAPASATDGTNAANVNLVLDDGTLYSSDVLYYPKVASGTYTPSDVAWVRRSITTGAGISSNSVYHGYLTQSSYARVSSLMVFEYASPVGVSSVTGVCDPLAWESTKPIYDVHVQDLAETGTKLWQHNGAHLLSWSRHNTTGIVKTNTSYQNLLSTATTVTTSTPGFHLNTQYHDTQKGDVPVEIGVIATRTAGTGTASVKLVDAAGTVLEETAVTTGTIFTAAKTITAKAATKTDIHVKANTGGATWRFDAIGLWEYEA